MAFLAGVVLNLPGIWYLDGLTGIAHAKPAAATALLQILLFNVIMFALVEIPIEAFYSTRGAPTRSSRKCLPGPIFIRGQSRSRLPLASGCGS